MNDRAIPRPTSFRIAPVTSAGNDEELQQLFAQAPQIEGRPVNIFGVLANHPKLAKRFNLMGGFILNKGVLDEREREIVILRVGVNCRSQYEFGQHTLIGQRCGLTDEEIAALASPPGAHPWAQRDLTLIAAADELCANDCIGDATWNALASHYGDAELIELVMTAGFYRMVSGFLNTMGVELDPGVPGFPHEPRVQ